MAVDKSGWDPDKCQATSKKRGDQCKNYPVRGLRVCLRHGGGSKRARAAAARNLETAKAERLAKRLGAPIKLDDPPKYILDLIATKAGEVEWLRHQVVQLVSGTSYPTIVDGVYAVGMHKDRLNAETAKRITDTSAHLWTWGADLKVNDPAYLKLGGDGFLVDDPIQ